MILSAKIQGQFHFQNLIYQMDINGKDTDYVLERGSVSQCQNVDGMMAVQEKKVLS